jgi:hypothetical protein
LISIDIPIDLIPGLLLGTNHTDMASSSESMEVSKRTSPWGEAREWTKVWTMTIWRDQYLRMMGRVPQNITKYSFGTDGSVMGKLEFKRG